MINFKIKKLRLNNLFIYQYDFMLCGHKDYRQY